MFDTETITTDEYWNLYEDSLREDIMEKEILNSLETMRYFGLSKKKFLKWLGDSQLKPVKLNGDLFFNKNDLDRYIDKLKEKALILA